MTRGSPIRPSSTPTPGARWPAGYAPAGAVVSTAHNLTLLARALLSGQAPGLGALEPLADTDDGRIGMFWFDDAYPGEQQSFQWRSGGTGGYSSYLAVDRQRQRRRRPQ